MLPKHTVSFAALLLMFGVCLLTLTACPPPPPEVLEKEVAEAEKAFAEMAVRDGIAEAFYTFAAPDAVIKRQNDTLIQGKDAIREFYRNPRYARASVAWAPDFVSVSEDGEMAYTYGKYQWEIKDSTGRVDTFRGVFHTVWKRQSDRSWKYVWD